MQRPSPSALNWAPGWRQLPHQLPLARYLAVEKGRRAICIWHRRAGKDEMALRWASRAASFHRVGPYWHMLPQAAQARKAIWDAVNPRTGRRRIDEAFPPAFCDSVRDTDMFIRLKSGSTWQLVGSDNYNSLVGTPPVGIVFSEFALADPNAWAYLSPILAENGGWAVFLTTPRGRNHAWRLFRAAQADRDNWFSQLLRVQDTNIIPEATLAQARKTLDDLYGSPEIGRAMYEQEYECSFDAAVVGSYYGALITEAERGGRLRADVEPVAAPVHTAWDLGIGDSTAIWWWQMAGGELRVLDYYESHGQGLEHYAGLIRAKPYLRGDDFVPPDARVREFASGRTRLETMLALGLNPRVVKTHTIEDGINAVRRTLPRCVFHERRCERGLDALRLYHAERDDGARVLANRPRHDWTSHAADAFRYLALAWEEFAAAPPRPAVPRRISVQLPTLDELWEEQQRGMADE